MNTEGICRIRRARGRQFPGITVFTAGRSVRTLGNALDEQIEDRLGGTLGLCFGDTPARKMTVDVHPGQAVNQSAAGDLAPLQVGDAQLAFGERILPPLLSHPHHLPVLPSQLTSLTVPE